ncbi:MAG: hypothetical protein PHS14_19090 [Elusimicrobia bacterium]|nr:hypothetical protein [Elusimicrobiota bacterium]
MRASHAVFLAVFVLALVGLAGLRSWRAPVPARLMAGTEPARIEVRRPREDLIISREAGGPWVVARQNDLADAESVELLLSGLRSLSFGPPVASSEAGLASGLGPADATRVRVLDEAGRPLFDGLFGRRLFGRSSYFRARDGDAVRLATGPDPELLLRSSAQWREPRLLPGGCAGGLEIFARGAWIAVPPDAATDLCALRASHWATGTPEGLAGFDRPLLRARTPDGRGFTVGERRGGERLVRVDGRTSLLRIPAASIEAAAADLIP